MISTSSFKGLTHKISIEGDFVYKNGIVPEGKSYKNSISYTAHIPKGITPIIGYPELRLSWLGSELTFHNAPYNYYYGNFNGTIKINDFEVFTGVIGDCCEFVYDLVSPENYKLRISEGDQSLIDWYLFHGRDPSKVDLSSFAEAHWTVGPNPDPDNTAATGSNRIFTNRIPGWLLALYHHKQNVVDNIPTYFYEACLDWSNTQSRRADKLYLQDTSYSQLNHWMASGLIEDNVILGHGYQQGGGPSDVWIGKEANILGRMTYYDTVKKYSRPYESMGMKYNDHLHFSNMQNIMIGLFLNKPSAIRNAVAMTEADYKHSIYDWFGAPRAFAGLIQSLAIGWHALYKYSNIDYWRTKYLPAILQKLENRNVVYDLPISGEENLIAPCLDKGKLSKSDHMYLSDPMRAYLSSSYGIEEDDDLYGYVAFWSTWQGGWLIEAILTVLELVPLSLDQYKRWSKQLKWAVYLTVHAANFLPSKHFTSLTLGNDPLGIPDDYAPKEPFYKGSSHNTVVGVQIRFLEPALRHYFLFTESRPELNIPAKNKDELLKACDVIMDYCNKQSDGKGYWNTSDRKRAGLDQLFYEDGYLEKYKK